ncbi:hypothetical protein RvY_15347 [Ramazzottius varieornatus]|uniref:Uncharacterized protein n=1 Tax=Ramazzottius varieornatus TaxID=947166 RepID=A0A1D1VUK9_RAMVA|nr:hypothetical protein RvY_15347 [Ramazzottius varieornatus]
MLGGAEISYQYCPLLAAGHRTGVTGNLRNQIETGDPNEGRADPAAKLIERRKVDLNRSSVVIQRANVTKHAFYLKPAQTVSRAMIRPLDPIKNSLYEPDLV